MFDTIIAQLLTWSLKIKNQSEPEGNTETLVGGLFEQIVMLVKQITAYIVNISIGFLWKEPVNTVADLTTKYPDPSKGWTALVETVDGYENGVIYTYNGTEWVDTGLVSFPTDVATQSDLMQLANDLKSFFFGIPAIDFDAKTITFPSGYFADGKSLYLLTEQTLTYEELNSRYIYLDAVSKQWAMYSITSLPTDNNLIFVGIVDIGGNQIKGNFRDTDLGNRQKLGHIGAVVGSGFKCDIDFNEGEGWSIATTAGYLMTENGNSLISVSAKTQEFSDSNAYYVYVDAATNEFVIYPYNAKPVRSFYDFYYIGFVVPTKKQVNLNMTGLVIDGKVITTFSKDQEAVISSTKEQLGTTTDAALPLEGWINKTWNNVLGTDGILFDKRCIISEVEQLKSLKLNLFTAGVVRIHLADLEFNTIRYEDKTLVAGLNSDITIDNIDYSQPMRVGVQCITGIVRTIVPADNAGNGIKKLISTGEVTDSIYSFAYQVETKSYKNTLLGRVTELEKRVGVNDTDNINTLLAQSDVVYLEPRTYIISETLSIPSGKTLIGVTGKTILVVHKDVKIGIDLRNVENVIIQNILIKGAYNGTPVKIGLQPVKAGIINTKEDAYSKVGAGLNTDMVNGGVTSEYIPQIGINIEACEKVTITGCDITHFSWTGITNGLSGKNYTDGGVFIYNNRINNCYCGIELHNEAERSKYLGNTIAVNQIGLFLDSGTNMFEAEVYTGNRVGMVMSNGYNHAHGAFTDCAFTHCSLFSFIAKDIQHGQVFKGCKVGYVDGETGNGHHCVIIENSRGIDFLDGQLINANIKFIGKFYKEGGDRGATTIDEFGNTRGSVIFSDITDTPSFNNGGVNRFIGNSVFPGSFEIDPSLDSTNVVLKDNFYISGQDSSALNNA